jgi:hypothetical protein
MRSLSNIEKIRLSSWDKHFLMGLYGPGMWVSQHAFPFTNLNFGLYFLKLN